MMHAAGDDARRGPATRPDRRALARRAAHQRSARADRERPGPRPRRDPDPPRQRRQAPRGRHGPLGVGAARPRGCSCAPTLPVGALFCVLRGPTRGRPWAPAGVRSQLHHAAARAPAFDAVSRRISSATRTRSRCLAKACRCLSSSASSGIMRVICQARRAPRRVREGEVIQAARAQAAGCSKSAGMDERGVDEAGV